MKVTAGVASLLLELGPALLGQATAAKSDYVVGEVAAVDAPAHRLTLKGDTGGTIVVTLQEGATVLRAKPGVTTLSEAGPLSLEEVAPGDRVMVRGVLSEDRAALEARQVVVMTRDDIGRKQDVERAEWRRRGILGVVTAVDGSKGEIAVRVSRWAAAPTLLVSSSGRRVAFRRYAPDSVKFADAQPSSLADVHVGDELRALGERTPEGDLFLAEQVVFGSFRVASGLVIAVDVAKGDVVLRDEDSQQSLTIAVGPDARVRRLPPELAARLARRGDRDGTTGGPSPRQAGRGPGAGQGPEDLLERLPTSTLAEIKKGDRIMVSSTKGADATRLNAIVLVTGLEALSLPGPARGARALETGLPPELLDLGMSVQ